MKPKNQLTTQTTALAEDKLFADLSRIIENRRNRIIRQANNEKVFMLWEIGKRINDEILNNQRAEYGKQIVATVSRQLQMKYGSAFNIGNVSKLDRKPNICYTEACKHLYFNGK